MNNPYDLERANIHEQLTELIPELKRRDSTSRVMQELGVDDLLDQLNELRTYEEFDQTFGGYVVAQEMET